MMFFKVLLCMAIGLAVLVSTAAVAPAGSGHDLVPARTGNPSVFNMSGDPNLAIAAADYDPSMEWHDYSTAQDWMGRNPVHVGNLVDMYLYGKVTALISQACPAGGTGGNLVCNGTPLEFETLCLHNYPEAVVRCGMHLVARGEWHSETTRNLLIIAAAGAFQAWTSMETGANSNCRSIGYVGKMYVVGDILQVNFPNELDNGGSNWMYILIHNKRADVMPDWQYDCCRGGGRAALDTLMSHIDSKVAAIFPWMDKKQYPHDSRCIIDGWKACH